MKKRYQSKGCKALLVLIEHVAVIAFAISMFFVFLYPGNITEIFTKEDKKYEDTERFTVDVNEEIDKITGYLKTDYQMDGKNDVTKLVDVQDYWEDKTITGENRNGLAYKLEDLLKWHEKAFGESYNEEAPDILVCQKLDGTYTYYYMEEFEQLLRDGKLSFLEKKGYGMSQDNYLDALQEWFEYQYTDTDATSILDSEGAVLYDSYWPFIADYGYFLAAEDGFKPDGAENLLDLVNHDERWNGKLSEALKMIVNTSEGLDAEYRNYEYVGTNLIDDNTNVSYLFYNVEDKKVYTNQKKYSSYENVDASIEDMKKLGKYVVIAPTLKNCESNIDVNHNYEQSFVNGKLFEKADYRFVLAVDTKFPIQDHFYQNNKNYEERRENIPITEKAVVSAAVSLIVAIIGFVWLTIIAGRYNSDDEKKVHLNFFDKWKTEIAAGLVIAALFFWTFCTMQYFGYTDMPSPEEIASRMIQVGFFAAGFTCIGLIGYLSLVRRIKAKTLWSNSVLKWLIGALKVVFDNRKCLTKTLIAFAGVWLLHVISIPMPPMFILALAADVWLLINVIKKMIAKQKIKDGIENITQGDVEYKIPTEGLKGDELKMAEGVNNIGEGIEKAVEASMKHERLKTDLITNVSHDIKTPLTSIINYVGLLKMEEFEDEKIKGYIDVLDQKSQRLKTLTEDVVEASKISSGNINLEYMNINLVELINQTTGEFSEKFEKRNLQIVLNMPEEPAMIKADSRRIWRVVENIYNNAAKYAMPGTRIYGDLKVVDEKVIFSLKNVSEQPLNISAEELTERFIRGDVSRSSEGSGLGLSIAQNLTKIQGGEFELYLDGDLFKVTIVFPRISK